MRSMRAAALLMLSFGVSFAQTSKRVKPAPLPPAPTAYTIETLAVEGNHAHTAEQILAATGLRVGQKAGKTEFEAARGKLEATGVFDNVSYRFAPSHDGEGYDVWFEVAEVAQLYPLRFEDLPAADAELRAWLKQKDPLFGDKIPATKPVVDRYVAWISEFLAAHNYHEPISGKLTSPESSQDLTLLFRPAKGYPAIAHVIFTGVGDLPPGVLQTAMYEVAIGVPYQEPTFRKLLDAAARPIYEAHGMLRVTFPKIDIAPAKDVDGVTVTVQVAPGPLYKLDQVNFVGADYSRSEWKDLARLKTDQTVNFDEVKAAQDRIRANQRRAGHLDATSQVKRAVNDDDHTVSIEFQINPGPLYTLGKVDMVGLDIETEPEIRKMWGIAAGQAVQCRLSGSFPEPGEGRRRVRRSQNHAGGDQDQRGRAYGGCDVVFQ